MDNVASGTNFFYEFLLIAGSKESFDEPKDLTGRIRESLKMSEKSTSNATNNGACDSESRTSGKTKTKMETKDEEPEKVQKCDKV